MYIVIACFEREITCIGKAKTHKEAHKIMKDSFLNFYKERGERYVKGSDEYDAFLCSDSACTNIDSSENADWKIINLEDVE